MRIIGIIVCHQYLCKFCIFCGILKDRTCLVGANPSPEHGSTKELTEAIVEPTELITKIIHHTRSTVIYTGWYDSKGDELRGQLRCERN